MPLPPLTHREHYWRLGVLFVILASKEFEFHVDWLGSILNVVQVAFPSMPMTIARRGATGPESSSLERLLRRRRSADTTAEDVAVKQLF